jgi:hypothetical protein
LSARRLLFSWRPFADSRSSGKGLSIAEVIPNFVAGRRLVQKQASRRPDGLADCGRHTLQRVQYGLGRTQCAGVLDTPQGVQECSLFSNSDYRPPNFVALVGTCG